MLSLNYGVYGRGFKMNKLYNCIKMMLKIHNIKVYKEVKFSVYVREE